jgi:hypothetical protein
MIPPGLGAGNGVDTEGSTEDIDRMHLSVT